MWFRVERERSAELAFDTFFFNFFWHDLFFLFIPTPHTMLFWSLTSIVAVSAWSVLVVGKKNRKKKLWTSCYGAAATVSDHCCS